MLELRHQLGAAAPGGVQSIEVEACQRATDVCGEIDPRTAQQARFSLPYEYFSTHRRGDTEAPIDGAELNAKFGDLVEPLIGAEASSRLRERL